MQKNRHIFLINKKNSYPKFNRQRNIQNDNEEEDKTPQPKIIKEFQKNRLRKDSDTLYIQRKERNEKRTILFPSIIDLIRISFYCVFTYDLSKKFDSRYGLSVVEYSQFNKTVMFEVLNQEKFKILLSDIQNVVNSPENTSYKGKLFNLIALIYQFEFITSQKRIDNTQGGTFLISLISSANNNPFILQRDKLFSFLQEQKAVISYNESCPDIIEVKKLDKEQTLLIANNFDIVKAILSTRTLTVRPGGYGLTRREFGFTVDVPDNLTTVCIIDSGVSRLEPLKNTITNISYDHTNTNPFWDEVGHGTLVAGLVILGDEFQSQIKNHYTAKAKIAVIKALCQSKDEINIPQLLNDIKDAKRQHGIRLFNMSLNLPPAKEYNDVYSQFAFELDKLAFEEDILIFISVGNVDADYIRELIQDVKHPDHEYPTFFYKPDSTSEYHSCKNTNIAVPSESLNNISVGALAGNLEKKDYTDITPNNLSPAYYSRKFHFDYRSKVNTVSLKKGLHNKHLNKPDLVFEGGDLFNYESGIEILRSPLSNNEKYFGRTSGTSLSTPLIASYAAEILNDYPELKTQTVKALLINAASYPKKLPHFKDRKDDLLKRLVGFGKPQKHHLLATDDNSIVFVIEDKIALNQILTIPIIIPEYLKESGNKLKFDISLCYSFMPVKDNHLNYLPLYMSFNLILNKDVAIFGKGKQSDYGIKQGFSWSEDHFGIENRLFSNAQFNSYILQSTDLNKIEDSIALGIRCLSKNEIPLNNLDNLRTEPHPFSVILAITEYPEIKASNRLYTEMLICNDTRNIVEAIGEIDIDLEI